MSLILTAFVHLTVLWLIGSIGQAAFLALIRVPVTKVQLFLGNTPLRVKAGGCEVALGWIPFGSSVAYDPDGFFRKPISIRLVGHFSSAIIFMGIACACLSPSQGWDHFVTGFRQIALGSWAPIDRATIYLEQWHRIAGSSPVAGFGILAAKMTAFSLFPLGGGVITQILADAATSSGSMRMEKLALFNVLLSMMVMALWTFAAVWQMLAG